MPRSEVRRRPIKLTVQEPSREAKHKGLTDQGSSRQLKALSDDSEAFSLSLKSAFRLFLIVRCASALYSVINDCDETFNFWEPTHYLLEGYGRQTWEYSPEFRIRSWAYIGFYSILGFFASMLTSTKIQVFYLIRLILATFCSFAEARFYRVVVEEVNAHVGRYVLIILFFGPGMFHASTAFLPSSFAMYTTMMAFTYILRPTTQLHRTRTYKAVFWLILGGIAWPFSGAIGLPFALEELTVYGQDSSVTKSGQLHVAMKSRNWQLLRFIRLFEAVLVLSIGLGGCVYFIDTYFYDAPTFVPWNIVKYNIFNAREGRGPELFGVEPWYFYVLNGFLNFNVAFILALMSGLIMVVTAIVDRKRVPGTTRLDVIWPYYLMLLKLAPFYIWFTIFSLQAHKEERFLYVAYPLLALNAGIAIYLIRSLVNHATRALGASVNIRVFAFRYTSVAILVVYSLLSVSRIMVQLTRYHAPMAVYKALWNERQDPVIHSNVIQENYDEQSNPKELQLCVGKEWHRYQSSFLLPNDVRLQFITSEFDGLLPDKFPEDWTVKSYTVNGKQESYRARKYDILTGVHHHGAGMNDLNKPDASVLTDISKCDYLVDSLLPSQTPSNNEPTYILDKAWQKLHCEPHLDASGSRSIARAFWVPGGQGLVWGEYCLLKRQK
ncbi:Alg9-like mannosyltransferase family-domain-containing protein [Gongronella butleri]|nr:Alg9-like mannosyltransferase family-domain-containing protein [Gongronella butleri]